MFLAGISMIGITHQVVWMATSPESLWTRRPSGFYASRTQAHNNLKQITLGALNYHDEHKQLPPGSTFDSVGNALHGWQTFILPYIDIEEQKLDKLIDKNLPWHDGRNLRRSRMLCQASFTRRLSLTRMHRDWG
jgi:hypothetical protein